MHDLVPEYELKKVIEEATGVNVFLEQEVEPAKREKIQAMWQTIKAGG